MTSYSFAQLHHMCKNLPPCVTIKITTAAIALKAVAKKRPFPLKGLLQDLLTRSALNFEKNYYFDMIIIHTNTNIPSKIRS